MVDALGNKNRFCGVKKNKKTTWKLSIMLFFFFYWPVVSVVDALGKVKIKLISTCAVFCG
jgi:hypothetical protein